MIGAGSSFHIAIAVSSHFIQVCFVNISERSGLNSGRSDKILGLTKSTVKFINLQLR